MKPAAARAARKAATEANTFNADDRASARERAPVIIAGVAFTRRRKDWGVTRAMRQLMREQEDAVSLGRRLRARVGELEAQQLEAAVAIETDDTAIPVAGTSGTSTAADEEASLETRIKGLITKADETTERAELVTYRLLAMLLVPPAAPAAPAPDAEAPEDPIADARHGFGPEAAGYVEDVDGDEAAVGCAVAFLQDELDAEDAADLALELTGSVEPDPAEDPSSATGSS